MEITRPDARHFEDFLRPTGWGLYSNFVVALACACNFVQAATFVSIPLAAALSTCNLNFIPEFVALRIFTTFYVGSCFGGLISNFLSDRYGRKRYLSYSLMLMFMSTFVAAFAFNAYIIMGAALFLGVGVESNMASIKLLMVEILPKERRGTYMVFCNIYWCLGYVFTIVLTILLETPIVSNTPKIPDPNLTTWRVIFAVCGGANLILACACALIEESPRYFLQMERSYLAYLVLKQMFAINNSDFAENFKIKEDEIKHLIPHYGLTYMEPDHYWDIFKRLVWRFREALKLIFSGRFCRTTCILIFLKIPLIAVGVLQLDIVLAKLLTFNSMANGSQFSIRSLDFIYPVFKPLSYRSESEQNESNSICAVNEYSRTFYKYYLILGSAMVPGMLISMLIVDRLGRKFILFTGLVLSGCSFLILRLTERSLFQLLSSCTILASIASVISILSLVSLEVYPTAIRGTAYGVTNFVGLLLTVVFLNRIVIESHIFIMIMGAIYICLSVLTLFLPEVKDSPMIE